MRPALTLGGVDYLLYAESPCLRHAAYAVIVVPSSVTRSARDVAAHLRVASSVAKVVSHFKRRLTVKGGRILCTGLLLFAF